MNVVLKNIDEKIRKNKLTKIQKKLLKNTEKFYKKFQCKIIYKNRFYKSKDTKKKYKNFLDRRKYYKSISICRNIMKL
jgi:hypothetical protein